MNRNPDGSVGGVFQGPTTNHKTTFIYYPEEQIHLVCELYDDLTIGSNGEIPPELHMTCPRCDEDLRLPGEKNPKTIRVEYLEKPVLITLANGARVKQVCRVSFDEVLKCGAPAVAGKGLCNFRFTIKDGRMERAK